MAFPKINTVHLVKSSNLGFDWEDLLKLANMAGSAGQFTHPSGIGGYWSYLG